MYQFSTSVICRGGLPLLVAVVLSACGGGGGGDGDPGATPAPTPIPMTWGARQAIESDAIGNMANASVAVDGNGNAVSVWERKEGAVTTIWANRYRIGFGWGTLPMQISSGTNASAPHVAVNATGTAVAVWREGNRIRARHYSITTNVLDPDVEIGEADANPSAPLEEAPKPKVTVDANGRALAVWQDFDGVRNNIFVARFSGAAWTFQLLETQDGDATNPQIAMDGTGNAIAVWVQVDGDERIRARRFTATTDTWAAVTDTLDNVDPTDAGAPQIAMNTNGNAIVVWRELSTTGNQVIAARGYTAGTWSPEAILNGGSGLDADVPQIAIDQAGNGIAVWTQTVGTKIRVLASRFAAGTWTVAGAIDADGSGSSARPKLAMNASGSAVVVWQSMDPTPSTDRSIWSNRYVAGWGPSTAVVLESVAADDAELPNIAVDTAGRAIAVWQQVDGSVTSIYSARYQ
jgi:hypothetical protein